jgi:synaptosomal-associated protein 25
MKHEKEVSAHGRNYIFQKSYLPANNLYQSLHVIQEGILREEDALTDLSNVLGQLKDMFLQMHSEISRQNEGITYLDADVHELNYRVKGANDRGRQLLRR